MVVCCSTLVEGILLTDSVVVVVVVVGAGFSTTVVHEVRSMAATASSGVRMISFFIVEVVLQGRIGAGSSARCISSEDFLFERGQISVLNLGRRIVTGICLAPRALVHQPA